MNRSANDGIRSSPHYGAKASLIHPSYQGVPALCLRHLDDAKSSRHPFERSASEAEATTLRVSLEERFAECRLTLHPEKTKIVYCKGMMTAARCIPIKGSTFSAIHSGRGCRGGRGTFGVSFSPAASERASKRSAGPFEGLDASRTQ